LLPAHLSLTEVDFTYTVFGLILRSNSRIPALEQLKGASAPADVSIFLGESPKIPSSPLNDEEELIYRSSYTDDVNNPGLQIWNCANGDLLHLVYYDGIEFWLEREGKALWSVWPSRILLEDVVSYLVGPVLGLLLRLRGVTCLHASAVAVDDAGLVFVGAEGAGKSTTAAAFAREGFGVISDDVVALAESAEGFRVMPAYPHLCLWPESVKMLYGSEEALPPFSPAWDKRRLALGENGTHFESRHLPLGAVYLLGERRADSASSFEAVKPQAALLALVADTFANSILDRGLRAQEFAVLGRLVANVPVRRIYPSNITTEVEHLCRVICEDYALLRSLAAGSS
jgi:hypothetical protein